jgi:hypothetical protein
LNRYRTIEPIHKELWYSTFSPKNCRQALKNMSLGSGISEIRYPEKHIQDPRSKGQKKPPNSGSATVGVYAEVHHTQKKTRACHLYATVKNWHFMGPDKTA